MSNPSRSAASIAIMNSTDSPPIVIISADFDYSHVGEIPSSVDLRVVPPIPDARPLHEAVDAGLLAQARALVIELGTVDEETLRAAPHLEFLVVCRGTPANVNLPACVRRGVVVRATPARNADATADLTLALIIQALRRTSEAERWLRARNWMPEHQYMPYETFRGPQLRGLTLGVIGYGAVGRRVAERARSFGMHILAQGPRLLPGSAVDGAEVTDFAGLLARSDVISLHASANALTQGLIGASELALMRSGAVLINTARASLVDEDALIEALRSGHLGAAALDVFWEEPLRRDHPLFDLPSVVMTPHIGGASDDVVRNHSAAALAHLNEWLGDRRS